MAELFVMLKTGIMSIVISDLRKVFYKGTVFLGLLTCAMVLIAGISGAAAGNQTHGLDHVSKHSTIQLHL